MTDLTASDSLVIVAAGPGWLVVDKPAGISVHNDPGQDLCSRLTAMLVGDSQLAEKAGFIPGAEVRAPHRLDRDTSGLVLLCCRAPVLVAQGCFAACGTDGTVEQPTIRLHEGFVLV